MNGSGSSDKRGRPRSVESRNAVLAAAFALLGERGYADLAIEAVAERAGVAKTTIYRWWPSRQALAVDAFFEATTKTLEFPDTGSASEDFRRQIHQLAALLRGPAGLPMASMLAGARHDPVLGAAVRERWIEPRRQWGRERIGRAVADAECVADLDTEAALELMYSPIYSRMLFGRSIPTGAEIDARLRILFRGIFLPSRP